MALVLIIEKDRIACDILAEAVHRLGHEACCASSHGEGLEESRLRNFALVLLNVQLPDGNGMDILPRLRRKAPRPEVIITTDIGDPDCAELAIRTGAWDYIQKPFEFNDITRTIRQALQYRKQQYQQAASVPLRRDKIIGDSLQIRENLELVAQAASSRSNTLIYGEPGTGKELFAAAIHDNSPRADKSFVIVDCGALPETLAESLLFGHEKGAFTGADRAQDGLIAQAHHGTLFLDEIGELPMNIQKVFLRVIQERRYRPVGGKNEVVSQFCLVAATNRNLDDMVRSGTFRNDLLHRLKTIQISLPPLRERRDDIKPLAQHCVEKLCSQYNMPRKKFIPEFFDILAKYNWPGNVRELHHALEAAVASAGANPRLFAKDLPMEIRAKMARDSVPPPSANSDATLRLNQEGESFQTLEVVRAKAIIDTERAYLKDLMAHTGGDIPTATNLSGLSRARFYGLLKKHGIATSIRPKSR